MLRKLSIAAGLVLWSLLAACGGDGKGRTADPPPSTNRVPDSKLALQPFGAADCSDFKAYVADSFTDQFLQPVTCFGFGPCPEFLGPPGPAATPAPGGDVVLSPAAPERVSQTNTQEAGVDEADIVKADAAGNLYVLTGRTLVVLDAFPPQGLDTRPKAVLEIADVSDAFFASDFFLDEESGRLVVLGASWGGETPRAVAVVVDVADPSAPVELTRLHVDGWPLTARRIGSRVHRVVRYEIPLPAAIWSDGALQQQREAYQRALADDDAAAADAIKAQVRADIGERVEQAGAQAFLPRVGESSADAPLPCDRVSRPEVQTGVGLAVLDSFDVDGSNHAASAAINNAYLVYASSDNLYLAQHSIGWWFADDQAHESVVYRFALSGTGAPQYRGFGRVPGNPPDHYALSEYEGHLRVASGELRFSGEGTESTNHLSVLRIDDGAMPRVGAVDDFAEPGEFIRGTRFIGARGFVVTFRQIDPLFAFDLSRPAQPRIADALKIPGFSSYLMPLGGDYLLTIGRGGDDVQLNGRVAIQLFDVSDLENLRQLALIEPDVGGGGYSWSAAEYDPHAFTYFSDAADQPVPGVLSVPVQAWASNGQGFAGFLVVRVDPAGATPLAELARLDHASFAPGNACSTAQGPEACPDPYWAAEPRRSVFMQDALGTYLYTISALGVLASDAANPATELGRTALPYDPPQCCWAEPVSAP